jgi:competence protein ComEC
MPRSGWLAVGTIAAAWTAANLSYPWAVALTVLGLAAVTAAWALRAERVDRTGRVALLGAGLVLARLLVGGGGGSAVAVPEGRGPWTFVVEATGAARDGNQTATLRSDRSITPSFRVAATLPAYPAVVPGDIVTLGAPIRPRPDSPYGDYLERIGVVGTVTARSIDVAPRPVDAGHAIEDVRQAAAATLAMVLPEPEAGLAAGILIGLRDRVDRDLAAAFTTAGVSHVVAISGWNIAIVAAAVAAVAGRMGRRRRSVVTMAAIVAYVVFAGASASVVRAGAMAGVVLLARESGRAGRAAAALGWAAAILLVADPGLVGDAGFQLSALATAGLIAWATPTTAAIERVGGGRVPRWLAESLGVSLAAELATLPVILVAFGRLAILAPVVNLVIVPLVAPAMAAGLVALLGGGLVLAGAPPAVGAILAVPGWVSLRLMVAIVDTTAAIPFASVTLPAPVAWTVAAGTVLAVVLIRARWPGMRSWLGAAPLGPTFDPRPVARRSAAPTSRAIRLAVVFLAVSVAIGGAVAFSRPSGVPRVSVMDVGQGDAILVEGSRGSRLLIDGGPDPARLLIDLDARIPPWDRRIDAVILTHPHEDHVAGLARLMDRYRIRQVFEPGMRGPGPGYAAWLARLTTGAAPVRLGLARGDRLTVDEIDLRVLWPVRGHVPTEPPDGGTGINNVSIVLLGAVGPYRMLLAGDVEQAIDPSLLEERLPRLDFLKVAHHGSKTATTQAFVDAVRPRVAVASAGTGNPYGHPAPATLDRLVAAGARVFRTDLDGTVVATFGPAGMAVQAEGGRPVPARTPTPAARTAAFRCGIPAGALIPEREPAAGTTAAAIRPRPTTTVGYHRADDGPGARGRRLPPALPGSPAMARAARARGGRGRRLAGGAHRRARDRGGPAARGGRGAAPRRGQGPAGRRSGARPPPRGRIGRLAHAPGAPRARPRGRQPPGHAPARRRAVPALGRVREPRGADRRVRRQARRAAARIDGRPLCLVAPTLPGPGHRRPPGRGLGRHGPAGRPRPRRAPGGRRLSRRRRRTRGRPPARLDR